MVYSVQPRVRLAARFTAFNVGDTYAYAYVQAPPLNCLTFCRVLCDLCRILDMPLLAERSIRWRGCNMTLQLGRNKLVVHYAFRGCFATFGNSNLIAFPNLRLVLA